jgi:hypothetical protein
MLLRGSPKAAATGFGLNLYRKAIRVRENGKRQSNRRYGFEPSDGWNIRRFVDKFLREF